MSLIWECKFKIHSVKSTFIWYQHISHRYFLECNRQIWTLWNENDDYEYARPFDTEIWSFTITNSLFRHFLYSGWPRRQLFGFVFHIFEALLEVNHNTINVGYRSYWKHVIDCEILRARLCWFQIHSQLFAEPCD